MRRSGAWYDYYADYSAHFVEDILAHLAIPQTAIVLDPWNGSGTTTQVAEDKGLLAFGYDINPVMIIVARARRLDPDFSINLSGLCNDVIKKAVQHKHRYELNHDPLRTWLSDRSVCVIRNIECAIQSLLLDQAYTPICKLVDYDKVNSLVSAFYTSLFQTVRNLLRPFQASNPTWIKEPKTSTEIADIDADKIFEVFRGYIRGTIQLLESRRLKRTNTTNNPIINVASSMDIPMRDAEATVVISSPPYCTRIDYAVATKPELAVLGYSQEEVSSLRNRIIGTTTIFNKDITASISWGETCNSFLSSVYRHGSKASNTYYYRNFLQYFNSMYRSVKEINRVMSSDGICVLVVQDSYYKDIHNDLPQIFVEFAMEFKWKLFIREDYPIDRTMAGINRQAKRYRSSSSAVESVLVFHK